MIDYTTSQLPREHDALIRALGPSSRDIWGVGDAAEILRRQAEELTLMQGRLGGMTGVYGLGSDTEQARLASLAFDPARISQFGAVSDPIRDAMERFAAEQVALQSPSRTQLELLAKVDRDLAMHRSSGLMSSTHGYLAAMSTPIEQAIAAATDAAERSRAFALPVALGSHALPMDALAARLRHAQIMPWWNDPVHLHPFRDATALSNMLTGWGRVDREMFGVASECARSLVPGVSGLSELRQFLDTAGLILPRWPVLRTRSEKRHRFNLQLRRRGPSRAKRKARSMTDTHETMLIEVIDQTMATVYGKDWAHTRLPNCKCDKLLRRSKIKGGLPLEHADFAHYELIMCHDEHFADAFQLGFSEPAVLRDLLKEIGELRAASHHAGRAFGPDDLVKMRVAYAALRKGLSEIWNEVAPDA